jgi:hypothetical protein
MVGISEINGTKYEYEYLLSNSTGEISFTDGVILAFDITDNLFNPFLSGYITISNPYNVIESTFLLRGDGTDKLKIRFNPKDNKDKKIEQEYIVISESNFIDDGAPLKNTKTYLLNTVEEGLLTAEFPYNEKYNGYAGDIIKSIFTKFKFPTDNFDPGNFIINEYPEYIIPPNSFRYIDVLYYFLKYYYYQDGDLAVKGFLKKDSDGKFRLKILTKDIFNKNEELVYEGFNSGELVSSSVSNPNNPPPVAETKPYINNIMSNSLTTPSTEFSNTFFMNTIVSGYDPILGESEMIELRLKDVRKKWKTKFVDVFKSVGGKVKQHLNLTDLKIKGEFKLTRLPFKTKDSAKIIEANMVNDFTFYNLQLNINVIGDPGRATGTFIDVFKLKNDKSKSDEKLLGRWLVTSVRHVKLLNTYRNEIYCVKTYVGPNFDEKDV